MKEVTISIKEIADIAEGLERAFFNWMKEEKIWWRLHMTNYNHIIIQEKDLEHVKEKFGEIQIVE